MRPANRTAHVSSQEAALFRILIRQSIITLSRPLSPARSLPGLTFAPSARGALSPRANPPASSLRFVRVSSVSLYAQAVETRPPRSPAGDDGRGNGEPEPLSPETRDVQTGVRGPLPRGGLTGTRRSLSPSICTLPADAN